MQAMDQQCFCTLSELFEVHMNFEFKHSKSQMYRNSLAMIPTEFHGFT